MFCLGFNNVRFIEALQCEQNGMLELYVSV